MVFRKDDDRIGGIERTLGGRLWSLRLRSGTSRDSTAVGTPVDYFHVIPDISPESISCKNRSIGLSATIWTRQLPDGEETKSRLEQAWSQRWTLMDRAAPHAYHCCPSRGAFGSGSSVILALSLGDQAALQALSGRRFEMGRLDMVPRTWVEVRDKQDTHAKLYISR